MIKFKRPSEGGKVMYHSRKALFLFILIGVIMGIILTANFNWMAESIARPKEGSISFGSNDPLDPAVLDAQKTSSAFVAIAEQVNPAVVTVSTNKFVNAPDYHNFFFGFPFDLEDFYGPNPGPNLPKKQAPYSEKRKIQGLGSGVIVSKDGYIITNNHVIEEVDEITITLKDRRQFKGKKIGGDKKADVAVIKIDADQLPVARLGDSDKLSVGEWVLAIGNPFGEEFSNTVTSGIISALNRGPSGLGTTYANFIQTDAAINPGNSGGALVNLKGQIIGINTAIASRTGGYQGIGLAIPINMARKIMEDLIYKGKVSRGWLGVGIQNVEPGTEKLFGLKNTDGVLVSRVFEDSPAEKAGIKVNDVIVSYNGQSVKNANELMNRVAFTDPGASANIIVIRDGNQKSMNIQIAERTIDEEKAEGSGEDKGSSAEDDKIGLSVEDPTSEKAAELGYKKGQGVLVTQIVPGSPAQEANLQVNDLILEINRQSVTDVKVYKTAVKKIKSGEKVLFFVKRKENTFFVVMQIPDKTEKE